MYILESKKHNDLSKSSNIFKYMKNAETPTKIRLPNFHCIIKEMWFIARNIPLQRGIMPGQLHQWLRAGI